MKQLTEENWKDILVDYVSTNLTIKQIATKHGKFAPAILYKKLESAGLEKRCGGPKKINKARLLEMIDSGMSMKSISEEFGFTSYSGFLDRLKSLGLEKIKQGQLENRRQLKWNAAIADYVGKSLTVDSILKKHAVSRTGLWKELKKRGISTTHNRKHFFREDAFDNPTPELAYQMGFGLADGSLCFDQRNGFYSYQVQIGEKDISVLENLAEVLELRSIAGYKPISRIEGGWRIFPGELEPRRTEPRVRIRLVHQKLQQWLEPWGIVQNKTYNYAEPQVPAHLLPAFLLGFFDGDGWVSRRRKTKSFSAGLCGSFKVLEWAKNSLLKIGFKGGFRLFEKNDWWGRLELTGDFQTLADLAKLLGADQNFCLQRKWPAILKLASTHTTE